MTAEPHDLSYLELLALLAGDAGLQARLKVGEQLRATTPFLYPGRRGPMIVHLALAPGADLRSAAPLIRISDGGELIKSLADQGMDIEVDMILSKTLFHAVNQVEGAGITGGQVHVDRPANEIGPGVWLLLQILAEVMGLRHAKYKDALVQLERRRGAETGLLGWRPT